MKIVNVKKYETWRVYWEIDIDLGVEYENTICGRNRGISLTEKEFIKLVAAARPLLFEGVDLGCE